ncbi:MiaB/RimO family radical SAM methylthiotransferase [Candidatus Poriferisodalis sp.]|uniref:MiaB/RimO family radical SAM methylthiotransferase n=1 Tax=Candidatus Poriferisodalis sp. TaxID=3101277 RepID=UPI003AF91D22
MAAGEQTQRGETQRSYFVRTYGCQMNVHDSERIAGLLEADDLVVAPTMAEADIIVLNTCCIRENADNKLYGQLGNLKRLKEDRPEVQIAVAGCLAQKDQDLVRERAPHVDVVFGTHNVSRAAELLANARVSGPVTEILTESEEFPSALPVRRDAQHAAWVTIQIGCDNSCAFCIVPSVRGREISRPFGELIDEVRRLAADGVSEVTLLGQNVNSYGRDVTLALRGTNGAHTSDDPAEAALLGANGAHTSDDPAEAALLGANGAHTSDDPADTAAWRAGETWAAGRHTARPLFGDLLRAVGAVDGIERVRFTSPHPKDLRADVISAMAETPAVCEHLHLPLQSGCDGMLAAMHRGYTAQRYLDRLNAARAAVANLAVSTDIIVGFPGESEADFTETLEVVAEARFDSAFTFVFSPRPGTEAAELSDRFVAPAVAAERMERLRAVVERLARLGNESRVGQIEEVLVEGPSKRDPGTLTGRTRQNRLVHFASPEPLRTGTYARVLVREAATFHLSGELIEVTAPARHRTRIPVAAR